MSKDLLLRVSRFGLAVSLLLLASTAVRAQEAAVLEKETATKLAVASPFSDGMVLQREEKVSIWGQATAGSKITAKAAGKSYEATADHDGKWSVKIGPLKAGALGELSVSDGDETVKLDDVLVGEVWVASGQSNMEWPMRASSNPDTEISKANWPDIRLLDVEHVTSDEPVDEIKTTGWHACTPKTVHDFSAVAFYFGRKLYEDLDVPIGLISCNWGGTAMEAWTSREALEKSDVLPRYEKQLEKRNAEGRKDRPQDEPGALFNGMLHPLIGYGIRGAIWYQGESNAGRHADYRELSGLMIEDWRKRWGEGDFPFLLVQLAAWERGGENWPFLREAQLQTLQLPNTGMAVTIDIGHRTDIHPKNKKDVGERLALAALRLAYGKDITFSGPIYKSMAVHGSKVALSFIHLGGGLESKGGKLRGFIVSGKDGQFAPAEAEIHGDEVLVWSDEIPHPTAVRYNWTAFPDGNLYNAEGLPASPFRTDNF